MKLNLGCNQWKLPGFVNIDIDPSVKPDVVADVRVLPYDNNSVDEIYAGHILEHLIYTDVALEEWKRVLKPGGTIIVTVPDIEKGLKEYREGRVELDHLNQIVFGCYWEQYGDPKGTSFELMHKRVFTEDILLMYMRKHFKNVEILEDCPYLVAKVKWQTICRGVKDGD